MLVLATTITSIAMQDLRAMPVEELTLRADAIVRGEVKKVRSVVYLGNYTQRVTFKVSEVLKGDSRWVGQELIIWAGSRIAYADDFYQEKTQLLLFLAREQTFFHTLNFQHGRFTIASEEVKNWRVSNEGPPTAPPNGSSDSTEAVLAQGFSIISKPYQEVKKEITGYIRAQQIRRKPN
ncbi:MAG: hypothetical protein RMM17_06145 [Acidobacteriota bacterium]|nr:hypothetical protein [Blastocatellia bacterium]MDW8412249.1 hypothetical protein [Acidobacteriota bacterium]